MFKIFNFFRKKCKKNLRLEDLVEKKYNTKEGVFVNIMNDLAKFSSSDNLTDKLVKMSYAYARRTSGAGLYLQGILTRDDFNYQQMMFQIFQQKTEHSVEFQEKAAEIANNFLLSYDARLTRNMISLITILALKDTFIHRKDIPEGAYMLYDELISLIQIEFNIR